MSVVDTDLYDDQMYDEDTDGMPVMTESQTLGISPGDPRMLPFPMNIAACVLITTIEDLRSGDRRRRGDARHCVEQGWLDAWVDRLSLPEDATCRVLDLLDDLAAGRPQY